MLIKIGPTVKHRRIQYPNKCRDQQILQLNSNSFRICIEKRMNFDIFASGIQNLPIQYLHEKKVNLNFKQLLIWNEILAIKDAVRKSHFCINFFQSTLCDADGIQKLLHFFKYYITFFSLIIW